MQSVLNSKSIYIVENGRIACAVHAGERARTTGRDLDGNPVFEITKEVLPDLSQLGMDNVCCESCGRQVAA